MVFLGLEALELGVLGVSYRSVLQRDGGSTGGGHAEAAERCGVVALGVKRPEESEVL